MNVGGLINKPTPLSISMQAYTRKSTMATLLIKNNERG